MYRILRMQRSSLLLLPIAALVSAVCAIVPLVLVAMYARGGAPFLLATYTMRFQPWEVFGAVLSAAGLAVLGLSVAARRTGTWPVGSLVTFAVALHFLTVLIDYAEFSAESPSWQRRMAAGEAVAGQATLHALSRFGELPSVAWLDIRFAALARLAWRIGGTEPRANEIANGVHYLWQCCQFFALMGAYLLLSKLWRGRPGNDAVGWLVTGCLVVLCFPLLRALRHDPVAPLLMLACTAVVAHTALRGGEWIAALGAAMATCLSGYGLLLLLPFLIRRRWAVVWRTGLCVAVPGISLTVSGGLGLWAAGLRQLWQRAVAAPPLEAGIQGTVRHVMYRLNAGPLAPWTVWAVDLLVLAVSVWWILRCWPFPGASAETREGTEWQVALAGALALLAVLVPTPWGSEYVLAVPLALLALQYGRSRPACLAVGVMLTVLLPGVDLPVARCHRAAGVVLLMWALRSPGRGGHTWRPEAVAAIDERPAT